MIIINIKKCKNNYLLSGFKSIFNIKIKYRKKYSYCYLSSRASLIPDKKEYLIKGFSINLKFKLHY